MAVHPHGLLTAVDESSGSPSLRVQPRAGVPAYERVRRQPVRVRARAGASLPCAEALGCAPLLRARGLQARIRENVRLAEIFEGWVESEPGWEVCAPRHFSLVCFRREGSDEENEEILERVNRGGELFISHTRVGDRYVLRLAIGSDRTSEADVRRAWDQIRS